MLEEDAFAGEAVEGGGFDDGIAVSGGVGPAPVVGDAEEHVGPIGGLEAKRRGRKGDRRRQSYDG